jgi:hypothetical protein
MLSRDFSSTGFDQSAVEAELQLSRGTNKTAYRFEVLDYNLNKIRDSKGVQGGQIVNEREAKIKRTCKLQIREVASGIAAYRSMVLADKPKGYWPLGTGDQVKFVFSPSGANMRTTAPFSPTYTLQTGDYLEYDIQLVSTQSPSVDFVDAEDGGANALFAAVQDQNGIYNAAYVANSDISPYAQGMWYHRKIPVPPGSIGSTAAKWRIYANSASASTCLVRNVQITDGMGHQRVQIYIGGQALPTFTDTGGTATKTQQAADVTGNGNDGGYINSGTGDAAGLLPGVVDTALNCTGATGGAVSVGNQSPLNPSTAISLEAWVSVTAITAANQVVVMKADAAPVQYWLRINASGFFEFRLDIGGADTILVSPAGVVAVANQAYHMVGTYDGATMKLYVNGLLVASLAQAGSPGSGTPGTMYFGANAPSSAAALTGAIDEVALYDYALSSAQVRLHWDAGNGNQNEINYESDRIKAWARLWMPFQRYLKQVGEFNTAGAQESWTTANMTGVTVANGTISGTSSSTAPSMNKTVIPYSVSSFPNVEVRMRISASGSPADTVTLQWQNPGDVAFSGGKQVVVNITDDGGFNTLVFAGLTGSSITALQLLLGTKNSATIEIDYVRPTEVWPSAAGGTWIEWPLGVFLPSTSERTADAAGVTRQVDGYDLAQLLVDDKVTSRYQVLSGQNYISGTNAITSLLTGLSISYNAVPTTATLPGNRVWPTGTEKLQIINDLLLGIAYKPLYFDENGVAILRQQDLPINRAPEYTYDSSTPGKALIEPNVVDKVELFGVANLIIAFRANTDISIIQAQQQNLNILSPTSYYRRGNHNVVVVLDQGGAGKGAPDQTTLNTIVANEANKQTLNQRQVKFQTSFFPHSHDDVFYVIYPQLGISAKFNESKWTLDVTQEGGPMVHETVMVQ